MRVTNTSCYTTFDVEVVYSAVRATLEAHDAEPCEVSVLLTDDVDMRQLNRDYRGIDAPTDVLAFSMREGEDSDVNPSLLGDLVVSLETAARQASTTDGFSGTHGNLETETAVLTVHGMLHLLGYDHQTQEEAEIMFEKQESIFRSLDLQADIGQCAGSW
ncbi:rRNA maturation RNase YbeY [Candidatus Poribacteria bacterium]|nr:rRNA maturation RNase YbeY [Candidatus Poribacteria bacterium]